MSESLRALLATHITNSDAPDVTGVGVELQSPRELALGPEDDDRSVVSLWLYQVERNPDMYNHPPRRVAPDAYERHPMPLNLRYLVTPLASSTEMEQALIGRVLQVFNDFTVLEGPLLTGPGLVDSGASFRIHLQPLTLEELTRVWDALREPYQLSVAYLVQAVVIDTIRGPVHVSPVVHAQGQVGAV